MRSIRLLVLISVTPLVGCQRSPAVAELSPADSTAIRATTDRWLAAGRARRWEDAAATYSADATLPFPHAEFKGRAAIQTEAPVYSKRASAPEGSLAAAKAPTVRQQ